MLSDEDLQKLPELLLAVRNQGNLNAVVSKMYQAAGSEMKGAKGDGKWSRYPVLSGKLWKAAGKSSGTTTASTALPPPPPKPTTVGSTVDIVQPGLVTSGAVAKDGRMAQVVQRKDESVAVASQGMMTMSDALNVCVTVQMVILLRFRRDMKWKMMMKGSILWTYHRCCECIASANDSAL